MISWHDIIDNATGEAGNAGPVANLTFAKKLRWASKARQLLQKESKAVRRQADFELDEFDEGYLDMSDDIWTIERTTYTASDGSVGKNIKIVSFDELEGYREQNAYNGTIFLAQDFRRFHIFPTTGLSGTLRFDYIPKCTPYSPSLAIVSGDWYGCSPEAMGPWLKEHFLDEEFEGSVDGIEAFVTKHIYDTVPSGRQLWWREMRECDNLWNETLAEVSATVPSHRINDKPKAYSGPV